MGAIIYLLQVSGCMAIFYLFYYLLLNRLTFFTINRYYLVGTLVLSFVVPALTIPVHEYVPYTPIAQVTNTQNLSAYTFIAHAPKTAAAAATAAINWLLLLKSAYLLVAAGLFVRLIIMLAGFFARLKNKQVKRVGNINIIHGNKQLTNGSFLNYIFLDDAELNPAEIQQIIAHEMLHVKLMHSVDRIVVKIIQIILWFNPFAYLYARSIEENHEFEVDREIALSTDKTEYADLLLHLSVAAQGMIYNNFSKVPLKKRIIMLFNQPSARVKRLVYVLVIPVLMLSCMAFATFKKDDTGQTIISKLKKPVEKLLVTAQNYTKSLAAKVTETGAPVPNPIENNTAIPGVVATADTNKKPKVAPNAVANADTIPADQDMDKMTKEQARKLIASAKFEEGKFYSRAVLDGGYYDMIQITMPNGHSGAGITVPHNAKAVIIIGDKIYEESDIVNFTQSQIDALDGLPVGVGSDLNYFKDQFPNVDFSKYGAFVAIDIDFNKMMTYLKSEWDSRLLSKIKANPNSVLAKVLGLVPGITINRDGTVWHNKEQITKFRIDGKNYTADEIKAEIKNLLANMEQAPPGNTETKH